MLGFQVSDVCVFRGVLGVQALVGLRVSGCRSAGLTGVG